jgi:hypothetical protein
MVTQIEITNEKKETAEEEIRNKRKPVDYNTLEYPIEIIKEKWLGMMIDNQNLLNLYF